MKLRSRSLLSSISVLCLFTSYALLLNLPSLYAQGNPPPAPPVDRTLAATPRPPQQPPPPYRTAVTNPDWQNCPDEEIDKSKVSIDWLIECRRCFPDPTPVYQIPTKVISTPEKCLFNGIIPTRVINTPVQGSNPPPGGGSGTSTAAAPTNPPPATPECWENAPNPTSPWTTPAPTVYVPPNPATFTPSPTWTPSPTPACALHNFQANSVYFTNTQNLVSTIYGQQARPVAPNQEATLSLPGYYNIKEFNATFTHTASVTASLTIRWLNTSTGQSVDYVTTPGSYGPCCESWQTYHTQNLGVSVPFKINMVKFIVSSGGSGGWYIQQASLEWCEDEQPTLTPTMSPTPTIPPLIPTDPGQYDCSIVIYADLDTPIVNVDGGITVLSVNCYTVIPGVQIHITQEILGLQIPKIELSRFELCVEWISTPSISLAGITFSLELLLVIPLGWAVRRLFQF
jgi:hypothetical protein